MKVIFKNVGQGDSIVLHWYSESGNPEIGIIDCNIYNQTNPVLDYLVQEKIREVKFIQLTHPHADHYSGLLDVLDYCEKEEIFIGVFYIGITPWTVAKRIEEILDSGTLSSFADLWMKADYLLNKKLIKEVNFFIDGSQLDLNGKYKLIGLSPSQYETKQLFATDSTLKELVEEEGGLANWVSNVTALTNRETSETVLFTADANKKSLARLHAQGKVEQFKNIIAAQVPHHGSKYNYFESFWQSLQCKGKRIAIISSGQSKYGHPHVEVIRALTELNYNIKATNFVHGLIEFQRVNANKLTKLKLLFAPFPSFEQTPTGGHIEIAL